jgi:ABC-type glycerol-3-phosphate transport system permease component
MSALPFFQWAEATTLGEMIRNSPWAFAVIESLHLLGLSVVGGAVLIVDLRLLGLGLRAQPVADVARDAWPWFVGSLIVMLVTGVGLFLSEAMKCYASSAFAVKMTCLALAIVFTFTIRQRVTMAGDGQVPAPWLKLVALVSLALWFGVGASGRWIGFSA